MELQGKFAGWEVNDIDGVIYDPEGNYYYLDEIRAIFYYREIARDFEGSTTEITSLKKELVKKIASVKRLPIIIDWGDRVETLEHPKSRK